MKESQSHQGSKIIDFCHGIGLDTVGFTKCRVFTELKQLYEERKQQGVENEFEEKDIEIRINPFIYMEEGKTIISIAFPYLHDLNFESQYYFSKYTQGKDYHETVMTYLKKVSSYIEGMGGKTVCLSDNNSLPERYIAKLCGLGFIGKNSMLITKKYGSYVFLGEIITNLELCAGNSDEARNKDYCESCSRCFDSCPSNAISEDSCNPNMCLSYITQKKHIDDCWFEKLNGRIFGCDTCQRACKYNKDIEFSSLQEFKPYEYMKNIDIDELVNMDNAIFRDKYKITSSGWRGKNILIRNSLINLFSRRDGKEIIIKGTTSPYIRDYYDRLLKYFKL